MYVRAIALALPLALGIAACKTSRTQSESGRTASTESSRTSPDQSTAAATPAQPGAGASTSTSGTAGEAGASAATTPAHSDDQTVTGKVIRISEGSVAIRSDMGEEKTLELVPQTMVKVDGQDASRTELKEGQEVRASFNQVEGRDVAVQIEAREATSGSGSTMMPGSSTGTGTDSGSMPGSTGTDSTGSSGATGTGSGTSTTPSPDTK